MPCQLCSFIHLDIYVSGPVLGVGHRDLDQALWILPGGAVNHTGKGTLEGFPEEVRFELRLEEWKGGG